jgi:uncharacterized protein (TIGR00255 family)
MLKSMTGFGNAEYSSDRYLIKAELRALNSKFLDLNLRLSQQLRDREHLIRAIINEHVQRGKVDVTVSIEYVSGLGAYQINKDLVKHYLNELKSIVSDDRISEADLLPVVMRLPDVLSPTPNNDSEELWKHAEPVIHKAIELLNQYREQEGGALMNEFDSLIQSIRQTLQEIVQLDPDRIKGIRERLTQLLNDHIAKEKIDQNRLEQELIFYMERLDFSEERHRLLNHCNYFLETMRKEKNAGRKLNFIAQEMGREINTLGSKANHAGIQQHVVRMKDDLEKIKEQLMNVL